MKIPFIKRIFINGFIEVSNNIGGRQQDLEYISSAECCFAVNAKTRFFFELGDTACCRVRTF